VGYSPTIRCDSGAQKRCGGGRAERTGREPNGRGAFHATGTAKAISFMTLHGRPNRKRPADSAEDANRKWMSKSRRRAVGSMVSRDRRNSTPRERKAPGSRRIPPILRLVLRSLAPTRIRPRGRKSAGIAADFMAIRLRLRSRTEATTRSAAPALAGGLASAAGRCARAIARATAQAGAACPLPARGRGVSGLLADDPMRFRRAKEAQRRPRRKNRARAEREGRVPRDRHRESDIRHA